MRRTVRLPDAVECGGKATTIIRLLAIVVNLQIALGLGTIDQESQLQDKWLTDERAAPRGSGAAGTACTACEIQLDLDDADNSFITAGLRFPEHVRVQAIIPAGRKEPLGTQSRVCSGLY